MVRSNADTPSRRAGAPSHDTPSQRAGTPSHDTPNRRAGTPSQRQLRVGELVRRVLIEILADSELRDPDLMGVTITVSEVSVSPDLKAATAWVMPLGGRNREACIAGLARAAPFLRTKIARRLTTRSVPRLMFRIDTGFDSANHLNHLMHGLPGVEGAPDTGDGAGDGAGDEAGDDAGDGAGAGVGDDTTHTAHTDRETDDGA